MSNMKMNIADRFIRAVEDVKYISTPSINQGEYDATLRKLNNRTDSMGIIHSVLVQGNTLYVVAQRIKNIYTHNDDHDIVEFYNCIGGDPENYSLYELFMPVINIDLSRDIVDPRKFIGGKVLVTEIDNIPVKTEFIGELEEINESPLKIARTVLRNMRNFLGPTTPLDDGSEKTEAIIRAFGYNPEQISQLMSLTLAEAGEGKVFNLNGEGQYYQDTAQAPENIITIKTVADMNRHLNESPMKTKRCHLPVKLFSAR